MAKTYTPIATTTASGNASSIIFDNLPQTYTDLVLVVNAGAVAGDMYVRFNNNQGGNYSHTWLEGRASGAISSRFTNRDSFNLMYEGFTTGSINVIGIMNIMNYTNSTTYKTALWREGSVGTSIEGHVGLWRATPAAITRIDVLAGGNFTAGSTFTIYGIKAA